MSNDALKLVIVPRVDPWVLLHGLQRIDTNEKAHVNSDGKDLNDVQSCAPNSGVSHVFVYLG